MKTSEFEKVFTQCYPSMHKLLNEIRVVTGNLSTANLKRASVQMKVFKHLQSAYVGNTANAYISWTKRVLKKMKVECIDFKLHKCDTMNISLDVDELKRIEKLKLKSMKMEYVRDLFLLSCYTGARFSDVVSFSGSNICDGMLVWQQHKTKRRCVVPATQKVKRLVSQVSMMRCKALPNNIVNVWLKAICQLAKVDNEVTVIKNGKVMKVKKHEAVSFHTARRTFCTVLYENGVDLLDVSKLAGHSSIEMTKRYITSSIKQVSKEKLLKYLM